MGTMNVVALRLWWDRDGQSQEGWIGVGQELGWEEPAPGPLFMECIESLTLGL